MMTVIRSSESDNWKDAVVEWDIDDCEEDLSCSSECVCGKENIKYLYTIRNRGFKRCHFFNRKSV